MAEGSRQTVDVAIVGGGIIGCAIALRLAQAGLRVVVLDRSEPGQEASRAAAGMLAPQGEMIAPRAFRDLCLASRSLYPRFAAEIEELGGQSVGYRTEGSLLVALSDEQAKELATVRERGATEGLSLQPLTGPEARARVPGLSPDVQAGLFVPGDHWVDNERLMPALLRACQRRGVTVKAGRAVRKFLRKGDRLEGLEAGGAEGGGEIWSARTFILAAGCWSGELARLLGIPLPLRPCRGQVMEFEAAGELPLVVRAGHHYLVPRPPERVLVGTTVEYVGFEKAVTGEGLRSMLEGVSRMAPFVRGLRFRRAWAGLRPDTQDHLPILGHGEIQNLVLATGHFRNGILLAPVTAEIIRDLVIKGSTDHPLEAYRPARFAGAQDAPSEREAEA